MVNRRANFTTQPYVTQAHGSLAYYWVQTKCNAAIYTRDGFHEAAQQHNELARKFALLVLRWVVQE